MDVTEIEAKLKDAFGPAIFDYLFLFGKKANLPKDIIIGDNSKLLKEYIITINNFFKGIDQPEVEVDLEHLEESFYKVMHEMYLFRFMLAQKFYSDFELVRVETWFENKILEMPQNDFLNHIPETFSIRVPDTLFVDSLGNFDEKKSIEEENKRHKIKSYISSIAFSRQNKDTLYSYFRNYTIKEFVPRLLEEAIIKICEKVMLQIGVYISSKVYESIDQKFTPIEAKNNVLSLIRKQIKSNEYFDDFLDFKNSLVSDIKNELSKLNLLDNDTIEIIAEEFWNIFCIQFDTLIFFPNNYYKVAFRRADPQRKFENNFTNLIDFYIIENNGSIWDMPIETYSVEFTRESKEKIFNLVTNGFINPNYNLQDYYYLYQ